MFKKMMIVVFLLSPSLLMAQVYYGVPVPNGYTYRAPTYSAIDQTQGDTQVIYSSIQARPYQYGQEQNQYGQGQITRVIGSSVPVALNTNNYTESGNINILYQGSRIPLIISNNVANNPNQVYIPTLHLPPQLKSVYVLYSYKVPSGAMYGRLVQTQVGPQGQNVVPESILANRIPLSNAQNATYFYKNPGKDVVLHVRSKGKNLSGKTIVINIINNPNGNPNNQIYQGQTGYTQKSLMSGSSTQWRQQEQAPMNEQSFSSTYSSGQAPVVVRMNHNNQGALPQVVYVQNQKNPNRYSFDRTQKIQPNGAMMQYSREQQEPVQQENNSNNIHSSTFKALNSSDNVNQNFSAGSQEGKGEPKPVNQASTKKAKGSVEKTSGSKTVPMTPLQAANKKTTGDYYIILPNGSKG